MLQFGDEDAEAFVSGVGCRRLKEELPEELFFVWLTALMNVEPDLGVSAFEDRIRSVEPGARSEGVKLFSVLLGDRYDGVYLKNDVFSPQLLLRLVRLAYQHVRPSDDAKHEDSYTPGMREHAEKVRNVMVSALLNAKAKRAGQQKWKWLTIRFVRISRIEFLRLLMSIRHRKLTQSGSRKHRR